MRKERKIINTNIRLNLCDEQDRQAWEYLQTMDREKYKSYTRAVVVALNDYFSREYRNEADPYLETREKEDAFLERVETAVRDGVKESAPMAIAKNLMEMLVPFVKESVGGSNLTNGTLTVEKIDGEITGYNQYNEAVDASGYSSKVKVTLTVKVTFVNNTDHKDDFTDQQFSAFQTYDSSKLLSEVQDELIKLMVKDITEQIFNATVANW